MRGDTHLVLITRSFHRSPLANQCSCGFSHFTAQECAPQMARLPQIEAVSADTKPDTVHFRFVRARSRPMSSRVIQKPLSGGDQHILLNGFA
jgi:hypothetical protein